MKTEGEGKEGYTDCGFEWPSYSQSQYFLPSDEFLVLELPINDLEEFLKVMMCLTAQVSEDEEMEELRRRSLEVNESDHLFQF